MPRGPTRDKLSGAEGVGALGARMVELAPRLAPLHGEALLDRVLQEFAAWSAEIAPGLPPPEMAARVRKLPLGRAGAGALERALGGADGNLAAADLDDLLEGPGSSSDPAGIYLDEPSGG